ncbi:MAG: hypothetical protein ACOY5B_18790 [Spirochaetota bacterium]
MRKVSHYSPENRILTTKIYHGDDLIGTERVEVSREAFVKSDLKGNQILVHNIGSDIFYVPLEKPYGFSAFISHAYAAENRELFTVLFDAHENILIEKTVKLRDPFAKLQRLSSGQKVLEFNQIQPNQQVAQVKILLDCVEKIGEDRWVNMAR